MKVRRKIMALGTALAMAFVMIASLVMVTDVKADGTAVKNVEITMVVPEAGYEVKNASTDPEYKYQDKHPELSTSSVGVDADSLSGYWVVNVDSDEPDMFYGTYNDGDYCYAMIDIFKDTAGGYYFDDGTQIKVNGVSPVKVLAADYGCQALVKFKIGGDDQGGDDQGGGSDQGGSADQGGGSDQGGSADQGDSGQAATSTSNIVTLTNGASATVAQADDGTVSFRYEKDFSYFENGGKLYIDGEEVPSDQYTARQGSTIITLLKQYASKLLDGKEHTVKAVFKDGEAIESKITVTPSAAANATTATTTKVTSPKTADALPIAGIALVFVGATAIGVIAIRRKNL